MRHPWILKYAKTDLNISSSQSFNFTTLNASNVQTASSNPSLSCSQPSSISDSLNIPTQNPMPIINNSATYLITSAAVNSATTGIIPTNVQSGAKQSGTSYKYHTKPSLPLTGKESFTKK